MATITISRQMGSLGNQVARETARLLNYRLMWRELVNQAARLAGAPEVALATIDELGLLNIRTSSKAMQAYRSALEQIILEQAEQGDVIIIGRAGQAILGVRPDVLHFRVIASLALRVERQSVQAGVSQTHAMAQIEASDRNRTRFLKRFYKVNLDDPLLYHLVINTGCMTPFLAASLIAHTAQQLENSVT